MPVPSMVIRIITIIAALLIYTEASALEWTITVTRGQASPCWLGTSTEKLTYNVCNGTIVDTNIGVPYANYATNNRTATVQWYRFGNPQGNGTIYYRAGSVDIPIEYINTGCVVCAQGTSWNPNTGQCEPSCDDAYNAALQQCSGDPEKLQIIDIEPPGCDIRCTPCVNDPDHQISLSPVGWQGVTQAQMIGICGGTQYLESYDNGTCTGYCQPKCEQQYMDLVSKCGGESYINTWNEETCTGTCIGCKDEHEQATAQCGKGKYTMNEQCQWECKNCEELYDNCVQQCGGVQKIASFQCSDGEGTANAASSCICINAPVTPDPANPDPEGPQPPGTTSTEVKKNPDGSWTTVTQQGTKNPDGTVTIVTTTTEYAPDGTQTSTSTTSTTKPGSELPTAEDEGEEEEEELPTPGDNEVQGINEPEEIDFSPINTAMTQLSSKSPTVLLDHAVNLFQQLDVAGTAPTFTMPVGSWQLDVDFSMWTPLANLMKWFLSFVAVMGTVFLLLKQWSF